MQDTKLLAHNLIMILLKARCIFEVTTDYILGNNLDIDEMTDEEVDEELREAQKRNNCLV